ncbi:glycosyltransferase [Thalassotalea piscium]|uniref:Colanic acid/amylovoran biosynthesis glycosyltransferase n=1 Tax=Thalassotalea piscium TaxID=1230533 RepID=A0A7X0TT37_9GAMM|nr:glycosyltransferase [Thalassotalea piscium]MBB6542758.1 colanic acid/amylovoran biosynthesis glycosyltransferase [Thalassotalea piscium]
MKIAIFVDQFPVLSQTFVLNQVTALIDAGANVTIIALNKPESRKHHADVSQYQLISKTVYLLNEPSGKVNKLCYRIKNILWAVVNKAKRSLILQSINKEYGKQGKSLLLASILAKVEQPLEFDAIVCHFGYNGILANKLRQLGALNGNIVTVFHGYEVSAIKALALYKAEYQKLFKQTELMLPISNLWREKLIELGCAKEKVKVHRMGVNLANFPFVQKTNANNTDYLCNTQKNSHRAFKVFTVARFSEKKGIIYAINAMALLPKSLNIQYVLAGYGELEHEIKQQINQLNLSDNIVLLGKLDQKQVLAQMHDCDIFLQPSVTARNGDMEGVPVAIMEAMAVGLPVISTVHSGIPELIIDGESGLLSPEKSAESLRDNIMKLYENSELRVAIVNNARKQIEQLADVNTLSVKLISLLEKLAPRR